MPKQKYATMVTAEFRPRRTHDLMPAVAAAVGQRLTWMSQGMITTHEYAGQQAWLPVGVEFPGWVPTEDLAEIERVG